MKKHPILAVSLLVALLLGSVVLAKVWISRENIKHWTPRYLLDRSLNIVSERLHPDWPWLTPQAVRFLELWLQPTDRVFEWGSGRSTLWIARRVRAITSVEHDPHWFQWVTTRGNSRGLRNIDLKLRRDDPSYAEAIQEVSGDFDLIIVDGQVREQCALAAIGRLRPGGFCWSTMPTGFFLLNHAHRTLVLQRMGLHLKNGLSLRERSSTGDCF